FAASPPPVETRPPAPSTSAESRALDTVISPAEAFSKPVDAPVLSAERSLAASQNESQVQNVSQSQNVSQVQVAEPPAQKKKSGAPVLAAVAALVVIALAI